MRLTCPAAFAQTDCPTLLGAHPTGVQRGQTTANARTGIRQFRVATPQGVSSVASLVVGDEPGVLAIEPNDTPEKAQAVTLPVTLHGRLHRPEKIDWYKFRVEAGAEVSFAVLASRLQFQATIRILQTPCSFSPTTRAMNWCATTITSPRILPPAIE